MKRIALIQRKHEEAELNMSPLIDMVFILLIFFLVTTSFVKEAGVEVKRPISSASQNDEDKSNMFISVSSDGLIFIENQLVDIRSLRSRMERWLHENPLGNVVIISDNESRWGVSIEALDQVRQAGISNVVLTGVSE